MPKLMLIALAVILIALCSCEQNTEPDTRPINDYGYSLNKVDFVHLYQNQNPVYNLMQDAYEDANGVPLYSANGQLYYHPVMIGHRAIWALSDYNNTHEEVYLNYAKAGVSALLERAVRDEDRIYFPYQFDFSPGYTTLTFTAPWYSGLAQGVLLSVLSRMYYLTEEDYYKTVADSVLNTFESYDRPITTVYVTQNDSLAVGDNYYWVDEYPHTTRRFTLNGSISGSFGLYDHWWVFGDRKSKVLFSREMTTIKDHLMRYRNPGKMSFYDLKFKDMSAFYHGLHQKLLNYCYLFTGDDYFASMSYVLFNDYH